MKDTVINGDGTSKLLKAPTTIPETFEEWREQLIAGTATLDIGLNSAGVSVMGTALNKANLLSDAAATAAGVTSTDPTISEAIVKTNETIGTVKTIANAAMPKSGGTFTGNTIAYSTNRTTNSIRNICVYDSTGATLQSTSSIQMWRK